MKNWLLLSGVAIGIICDQMFAEILAWTHSNTLMCFTLADVVPCTELPGFMMFGIVCLIVGILSLWVIVCGVVCCWSMFSCFGKKLGGTK